MKKNLELIKILNRLINESTNNGVETVDILAKYAEEIDELYGEKTLPENPWTSPFPVFPVFPNFPIPPFYPTNPQPYEPNQPWKPIEIWCEISKIE